MSDFENGNGQSGTIGSLAAALAKAQSEFKPIERTRTVAVKTQAGGVYKFAYAPLDTVLEATRAALTENDLCISSQIQRESLRTVLMHSSGEWVAAEVALPQFQKAQELGSFLTYARRYSITALLGVASEEDDDANAADGNAVQNREDRAPRQVASRQTPKAAPSAKAKAGNATEKFMGLLRQGVHRGAFNDTIVGANDEGRKEREQLRGRFAPALRPGDFPNDEQWAAIFAGMEKMIANALPPE